MGSKKKGNEPSTPTVAVNFNAPVTLNFNVGGAGQDPTRDLMRLLTLVGTGLASRVEGPSVLPARADEEERAMIAEKERQALEAAEDRDKHPEAAPDDESVKQAVANTLTPANEATWENEVIDEVGRLVKEPRESVGFDGSVTKAWLRSFAEENGFSPDAGSQLYGVFGRTEFRQALTRRGVELPLGDNDGYRPEDVVEVAKLGEEFAADPKVRTFGPRLNELLQKLAVQAAEEIKSKSAKDLPPEVTDKLLGVIASIPGNVTEEKLVDFAKLCGFTEANARSLFAMWGRDRFTEFLADRGVELKTGRGGGYLKSGLRKSAELEDLQPGCVLHYGPRMHELHMAVAAHA